MNIYQCLVRWWIQAHTLYFLSTCIHIYSYIKFPIFVLLSFLPFFFLSRKDGNWAKVAFVSSRLENLHSRTAYFSTVFNSKHKTCRLNPVHGWLNSSSISVLLFSDASQGRRRRIFHRNMNFENCSVGKEIKLPHMRRRLSNAHKFADTYLLARMERGTASRLWARTQHNGPSQLGSNRDPSIQSPLTMQLQTGTIITKCDSTQYFDSFECPGSKSKFSARKNENERKYSRDYKNIHMKFQVFGILYLKKINWVMII